jgi:putative nucleotidyltransferase with HDIG domain
MLRTIDSEQLRPGMYVHKLLGSWVSHPFWRSSFLADADDVARIQASAVAQVVIDVRRGLDPDASADGQGAADAAAAADDGSAAAAAPAEPAQPAVTPVAVLATPAPASVSLEAEVQRARRILEEGRDAMQSMFNEVRLGRSVDPEAALPLVAQVSESVLRNPHALISVARLKTADDYTYLHSMAVAAMMGALARQLGLSEAQVLEASMGGLLHDMGKAATPSEILNKPGKLTDAEFEVMRKHAADGHRLLREGGVENAVVLDIALHHHEKVDGSGYPHRLAGNDISLMARMGAVCDVYDAISSDRPYKRGWDPAESLKRMASWHGHFDPSVFQAFVKCLGIYPVGSLVRLESQRLAVVLEQTAGALLKPRVRAFYSVKLRSHVLQQDIDLSAPDCNDRIVQPESAPDWGFRELDKLWLP